MTTLVLAAQAAGGGMSGSGMLIFYLIFQSQECFW